MRKSKIISGFATLSLGTALLLSPVLANALPIYCYWGGPDWSGGKDRNQRPGDVMDAAFMRHDAKYEQLRLLTGKLSEYQIARGFMLADQELINELNAIDPRKLVGSQCKIWLAGRLVAGNANQLRLKAIAYFQGQVTARKISVIRAWEKEARKVLAARR